MPEIPNCWIDGEPDDIVEEMRGFADDHEPDGWPAVRMSQITALCDEIDMLRSFLATIRDTGMTAEDAAEHAAIALTHNALAQADAACGVSPGAMGSAAD